MQSLANHSLHTSNPRRASPATSIGCKVGNLRFITTRTSSVDRSALGSAYRTRASSSLSSSTIAGTEQPESVISSMRGSSASPRVVRVHHLLRDGAVQVAPSPILSTCTSLDTSATLTPVLPPRAGDYMSGETFSKKLTGQQLFHRPGEVHAVAVIHVCQVRVSPQITSAPIFNRD